MSSADRNTPALTNRGRRSQKPVSANSRVADAVTDDAAGLQLQAEHRRSLSPAKPITTRQVVPKTSTATTRQRAARSTGQIPKTPQQTDEDAEDTVILNHLNTLRTLIEDFCEVNFDFKIKGPIEPAFVRAPPELISYVGCIAMGGPNGQEGWRELIDNIDLRKALVHGIIDRALQEHVLASLCFGASQALITTLEHMEKRQVNDNGFHRAAERATVIRTAGEDITPDSYGCQIGITRLTIQLEKLLHPIRELHHNIDLQCGNYTKGLQAIVAEAVYINQMIQMNGNVVYFFQPVFKDEEFDPFRMECQNLRAIQSTCPMEILDDDNQVIPGVDPHGDPTDIALVRIVCSNGCVAWRKGGGSYGERLLADEAETPDHSLPPELQGVRPRNEFYGRVITKDDGLRTKVVAKALVALRWGKPQFEEDPQFAMSYVDFAQVRDELHSAQRQRSDTASCSMM